MFWRSTSSLGGRMGASAACGKVKACSPLGCDLHRLVAEVGVSTSRPRPLFGLPASVGPIVLGLDGKMWHAACHFPPLFMEGIVRYAPTRRRPNAAAPALPAGSGHQAPCQQCNACADDLTRHPAPCAARRNVARNIQPDGNRWRHQTTYTGPVGRTASAVSVC